jgi:HAD superfamily hydrolase (TIGR01509 family)
MPIRAVFFDFDGVIADTENVHVAAWERAFASMGWDVAPEVCARAAEEDDHHFLKSLFAEHGIADGDISGWIEKKQAMTLKMLRAYPRNYAGFTELVGALRDRYQLGVVTGTWRANVETVLSACGLETAFRRIVGKEDVKATKPDGEAYRLAHQSFGVKASEALALEDSPTGVQAAKAAGIHVIAIGHRREAGRWSEGIPYVRRLSEWPEIVRRIEELGG